jgi:hypothetical protein
LAAVGALVLAAGARGYATPAVLNDVARSYSLGVGQVRCASSAEWESDFAAASGPAYTNLRNGYAVLGPVACEGALNAANANVPGWQRAFGTLALVHEAFHLRRWRFRRNEGKVECQAIVHFKEAAQKLGATEAEAEDLYPYALAWHERLTRLFSAYRDPACLIPPWNPPLP